MLDALPHGIIDDQGIHAAEEKLDSASKAKLNKRIREMRELLHEDERVNYFQEVKLNFSTRLLVVTSEQLLLREAGDSPSDDIVIQLGDIGSAKSTNPLFGNETVTIETRSRTTKISSRARGTVDHIQSAMDKFHAQQVQPAVIEETTPADLGLDDLAKLAELRDAGLHTEEEFTAGKARILGM